MKPVLGKFIAAIAVLAFASPACSARSQESAATFPAPPTVAAVSLLRDDFSSVGSGWTTGADQDSSITYEGGGLHIQVFKPGFFAWSNPNTAAYENVHLDVTVRNPGGGAQTSFGLLCDQQPSAGSYYYFAVTPSGQYEIGKSVMGQQNMLLTGDGNWSTTDLIARNAPSYQLSADCGPGRLTLYVDGRTIDSVRDMAYIRGEVGVFLWSDPAGTGDAVYDNFSVTRLK